MSKKESIKKINSYYLKLMEYHPLSDFDGKVFLSLLQDSLSLWINEKKRIITSITILSQDQIDKLTKVFENEKVEFRKLVDKPNEVEEIKRLHKKAVDGWQTIYDQLMDADKQKKIEKKESKKIEDIKKSLGL